jgi:WD40 repeat protein
MNIKVDRAISCTMTNDYFFCGCSDGVVRIFGTKSLDHILTLPKPPPLGTANIESGVKKIRIPATKESKFADCLGVIVDEVNMRVVVLYSDRMIFIWDIKDLEKISVYRTALSHCGPIHDIQYIPNSMEIGFQDEKSAVSLQEESSLTKFVTCSSDRTLRFWHFTDPTISSQTQQ